MPPPADGWDFGLHHVRIKILPDYYIGEENGNIDWTTLDIVEIKMHYRNNQLENNFVISDFVIIKDLGMSLVIFEMNVKTHKKSCDSCRTYLGKFVSSSP